MKTNIDHRRPMQMRTSDAVIEAATALQAIARPVFTASGAIDEVYLYRGGQLRASIFKPTSGRLGIWRAGSGAARADTPEEAVRRTLDPDCNGHRGRHWGTSENTHATHGNPPLSERRERRKRRPGLRAHQT